MLCSYFLSPCGRFNFRHRYSGSVSNFQNDEKYFKYPTIFEESLHINDNDTLDETDYRLFLENSINKAEAEEIGLCNIEPAISEEGDQCSELYLSYSQYYKKLKEKKFEEILNIDLFQNIKQIAEDVLTDLASRDQPMIYLIIKIYKRTNQLAFGKI